MYVPLEIAQLLKNAGFKDPVFQCYDGSECLCSYSREMKNYNNKGGKNTSAPIYQQALDWLFENHLIWISIELTNYGFCANVNAKVDKNIIYLGQKLYFEDQYQALNAGFKLALNKIC